jgi:hypothetical protein
MGLKGVQRLGFGCCNQQQQQRGEGWGKMIKKDGAVARGGGVVAPMVSESEKKLGSDYHVSGDGLPRN